MMILTNSENVDISGEILHNEIVISGWVGMEGSRGELHKPAAWTGVQDRDKLKSIAAGYGASCMYELEDEGLFEALWMIANHFRKGLMIEACRIPVRQETIEYCERTDLNPYLISSKGCFVILTPGGYGLAHDLNKLHICSEVAGRITEGNDRIVVFSDRIQYLSPP